MLIPSEGRAQIRAPPVDDVEDLRHDWRCQRCSLHGLFTSVGMLDSHQRNTHATSGSLPGQEALGIRGRPTRVCLTVPMSAAVLSYFSLPCQLRLKIPHCTGRKFPRGELLHGI
jgi:hypothetical protein